MFNSLNFNFCHTTKIATKNEYQIEFICGNQFSLLNSGLFVG